MYEDIYCKQNVIKERITYIGNQLLKQIRDEDKKNMNRKRQRQRLYIHPLMNHHKEVVIFLDE